MTALAEKPKKVVRVDPNAPWPLVPLGDLAANEPASITDGPFGSKLKSAHYTDSGPRVIRLQNIGEMVFVDAKAHISESHFDSLKRHRVFPDDLVIAALGENPPRACMIPDWLGSAIVKADCIRFKCGPLILPKFLLYALHQPELRRHAKGIIHGVGRPRLNLSEIKSLPIPVPPLPEQRRIVAEIEQQFTRLDAGVAALRRTQANLKRYHAAVLKAACEGRLVPTEAELARENARVLGSIPTGDFDSPSQSKRARVHGSTPSASTDFETGEALLSRILVERRKNWPGRGKFKEPALPDTHGLPTLPSGWVWASIDQLCGHITSGSRDWSQFYGKGSGTFILAQNVRPMHFDMSERQSVAAPKGDAETERTRVQQNDILITIVGAKTGDICRVPQPISEHFVCQSVALLRPVSQSTSRFIELYLASPENGQAIWKRFIYGQGRPHLGFDELRTTAIALPPLAEQTRIVAEVERRLSVVDELESVVKANLQRATRLRQSTLQQAFTKKFVSDK